MHNSENNLSINNFTNIYISFKKNEAQIKLSSKKIIKLAVRNLKYNI